MLKNSPIRGQVTEGRQGAGQVIPGACQWPGLQSLISFPTWDVVITPPHPINAGALCGQSPHTSGNIPTAVCVDP